MIFPRRATSLVLVALVLLAGCHPTRDIRGYVRVLIESSPNNLDVRQGTDAQSERIGALILEPLVHKDEHGHLQPWLSTSWEQPDAQTLILHLRGGVRFHNGHPLEAADVAWSLRTMTDGTLITPKAGAFASVDSITTPDVSTLVIHTRVPAPGLLFNLSEGLFGVVERGTGRSAGLHPVGTGPFRFVSQLQDKEVILAANNEYWNGPPQIAGVRFQVVPDTITAALEMKKGEADLESNILTLDMVESLRGTPHLAIETGPSHVVVYMNFNTQDATLRDVRVRQAIACAIDKPAIIAALWRGYARPAVTLLPAQHWAATTDVAQYPHDTARAVALLKEAGFAPDARGVRLHITLKTSNDETVRLLAQALQAELREAGIELTIRSSDFGTFYSDITKGAFQMYVLRWIGVNEDPDIFRYAYGSASVPPRGGNRGRFSDPRLDAVLAAAGDSRDPGAQAALYSDAQRLLAEDLPGIPLWYPDNVVIHSDKLTGVVPEADGGYGYLARMGVAASQPK